jgi:hypothetical protein
MGGSASSEIPFADELAIDAPFACGFDPPVPEFRTSSRRGIMKAGSKYLPCRVLFTPKDPKKQVVSTLVVMIGEDEKEYGYIITGSVCGFGARSWGKRGSAKQATLDENVVDPPSALQGV